MTARATPSRRTVERRRAPRAGQAASSVRREVGLRATVGAPSAGGAACSESPRVGAVPVIFSPKAAAVHGRRASGGDIHLQQAALAQLRAEIDEVRRDLRLGMVVLLGELGDDALHRAGLLEQLEHAPAGAVEAVI